MELQPILAIMELQPILAEAVSLFTGREITYKKESGEKRSFTVLEVTTFARAKSTGKVYLRAKMLDHDDGLSEVERTLHLEGIEIA
jgi:hypothetical protein